MSTQAKYRPSNLSLVSGAVFLVSWLGTLMFESPVLLTIGAWSVPVLLIALVIDVCHKRYWAVVPLVVLVAALVFVAMALISFDIPVGG